MTKRFGVAIIGLHNWYHAYPLTIAVGHMPCLNLVTVSHDDPLQLEEFSNYHKIKDVSTKMSDTISRNDVDIIVLTSYTSSHLELVRLACEEGKHVLCIKPLEISLARADEMVRDVEKSGIKFMMGHCYRVMPQYEKVAMLVNDGAIGDVLAFVHSTNAPLPKGWVTSEKPGWYVDSEKAGYGGFIDHAAHQFDALRYVFGKEGKTVSGYVGNILYKDLSVEDYGVAITEFETGIVGTVESTWITVPPGQWTDTLSLRGTRGNLAVESSKIVMNGKIVQDVLGRTELSLEPLPIGWCEAVGSPVNIWYSLLKDLADSIVQDSEPSQTIYDGLRSLELSTATYESAKKKRSVRISELR